MVDFEASKKMYFSSFIQFIFHPGFSRINGNPAAKLATTLALSSGGASTLISGINNSPTPGSGAGT